MIKDAVGYGMGTPLGDRALKTTKLLSVHMNGLWRRAIGTPWRAADRRQSAPLGCGLSRRLPYASAFHSAS